MTARGLVFVAALLSCASFARADERVHAGSGLKYDVVPPPGWNRETPLDLVLVLHGSGDTKENMRRGLRVVAPAVRRRLCVFVQSPEARGWPLTSAGGIASLSSAVRAEHPVLSTFVLGYSAGGSLATQCLFEHPEAFDGALVTGAIAARQPPGDPRVRERLFYWAVNADDTTFGGRDAVERLRAWLGQAGYDPARWRIDLREEPGLGHRLDGAALERGLDWLHEQALAREAITDDDRARLARVPALLEAKDAAGLREAAAPILASRRGEARAQLVGQLLEAPKHRDAAVSRAGLDLLGRAGDARAATAIARSLPKLQRDPERRLAALRALGALPPTPESLEALLAVVRRRDADGDLAPQRAAAAALACAAGRGEVLALINELNEAEREGRAAFAEGLDLALREVTGHELSGGRVWRAWWEQLGRKEPR